MPDETLSFATRLWFAWVCFFRVLFDGAFAARAFAAREPERLPPRVEPTEAEPDTAAAAMAVAVAAAAKSAGTPAALPVEKDSTPALQLLSLLQREGRLVDFLQQDIAAFSDADVGVAARLVHDGCAKALRAHATIEPVRKEEEGARVKLEAGFDADAVKLVGDVKGAAPYQGVLRHRGWRAAKLELPGIVGDHDARVLAPAEVELG